MPSVTVTSDIPALVCGNFAEIQKGVEGPRTRSKSHSPGGRWSAHPSLKRTVEWLELTDSADE